MNEILVWRRLSSINSLVYHLLPWEILEVGCLW